MSAPPGGGSWGGSPWGERRWSPESPFYGAYPGFHFNVDIEPRWPSLRSLVEARARTLGYAIRDAGDLRPRFRTIRFTGTRWMEFVEGGLRFDVLGVLNVDEPLGYHVLRAGQTQRFHAFLGLFDREFARTRAPSRTATTAEADLAMELTDEALGFDLLTDRPIALARFPAFAALHAMWAAASGRAPLRVLHDEDGGATYQPMPWAPDFAIKEWDGGAALRFESRELAVTIELTPMRAAGAARAAAQGFDSMASLADTQDEAEAVQVDDDIQLVDDVHVVDDDDTSAEATSELGPRKLAEVAEAAERLPSYPIADDEAACPSCGEVNEAGARFCAACGAKLA